MPAFFENYEEFRGDGSRNEKGETLDEFLAAYDPSRYTNPCCTVDIAVFGYSGDSPVNAQELKVLLIRRRNHPSIGDWALPGGFIDLQEDLEESARRELYEETHVRNVTVEQVGAFGDVRRDPRARIITTAFMSLVCLDEVNAEAGDDAKDADWFTIHLDEKKQEQETIYEMRLSNEKRGITMAPCISLRWNGGLVREKHSTVLVRDHTASDHAAVLLQAYLKLKERLNDHTSK